jgi:hypothetical protein
MLITGLTSVIVTALSLTLINSKNIVNMKTKQPVYVIDRKDFDYVFPIPRSGWAYGLYFGTITCAEDWQAMRDEIKFDENDQVLISKVMEAINERYNHKLIGRSNGALVHLKKQINYRRKPKDV